MFGLSERPLGLCRAAARDRLVPAALREVVRNKKVLQLGEQAGRQSLDGLVLGGIRRRDRDREQAIIADGLAFFGLLCRDRAYQLAADQATGKTRGVAEYQDVQRIAIVGQRSGDGAEIAGKKSAGRQDSAQPEALRLLVVLEFVGTAFR